MYPYSSSRLHLAIPNGSDVLASSDQLGKRDQHPSHLLDLVLHTLEFSVNSAISILMLRQELLEELVVRSPILWDFVVEDMYFQCPMKRPLNIVQTHNSLT